ncbi:mitotic checkpoint serine/threonine-protein kinase BUB1 [Ipomoea triloba]|uniref:mitotic checkpoint serine/threonine-protein kinase BUB1 n=1 Tax=Ipomoea triloba TaxID=35885 RepID=UPI00125E1FF0|nr:mitotic checkpoint serine/threonine-protein kinase BUB1 [Ipomoea triloba]
MAVISKISADATATATSVEDPLVPWLWSIKKALDSQSSGGSNSDEDLDRIVSDCVQTFKTDPRYQNDVRFLQIWFLYMDGSSDYDSVFREMLQNKICLSNCMLYEKYALLLEAKCRLIDAFMVYHLGISRNAEPLGRLKKAQVLFLERVSEFRMANGSLQKDTQSENGEPCVNPWLISVIKNLLQKLNPQILKYDGYHLSKKAYPGKVSLSTLLKSGRNKTIDLGGFAYQIKGCAGKGGFAQVFKAYFDSNPDEVVALKIQKPAFPWEFYMYRQLDIRIPQKERLNFGFAHRLHLYSDYSILVSDFVAHGTLQDAINSNAVIGGSMEEILCIYYTTEMLCMLETLHGAAIIHGDFKPDNLLIRYARDDLTEDKEALCNRTGPWHDQGLCLVDWGRGIDLSLFPEKTQFIGDCRTSGFRCIEMQENKPWTFQVDTYGLCVIVHMMLYNSYMEIDKRTARGGGGYIYQPKSHLKRYWNIKLWENLFTKLLNPDPNEDHQTLLKNLRESFQDYMCSDPQLLKRLRQLLLKQKSSLCSS